MPRGVPSNANHATVWNWMHGLGIRFNEFELFTVVRHPIDRAYSAWCFLVSQHCAHQYWFADAGERSALAYYRSFDEAVVHLRDRLLLLPHFGQMVDYTHLDGTNAVQNVLRFESLADDWAKYAKRWGIEGELPHENPSRARGPWQANVGPEAQAVLRQVYEPDFEVYGYA